MLILSGCALLPQPEILPPRETEPPRAAQPENTSHYRITEADLEIHTFSAGWLAHLAHAHVLETSALSGDVFLAEPVSGSTARLYFRPWDLQLDEPASRAAAGAGFESTRSEADIAATRTRMLGPRGFDSNRFSWVIVDVRWADTEQVALAIRFRDATYELEVPFSWSIREDQIQARADFELEHRDLGLRPYSAFAGAIAVAEPIRVQLTLSARPASSL